MRKLRQRWRDRPDHIICSVQLLSPLSAALTSIGPLSPRVPADRPKALHTGWFILETSKGLVVTKPMNVVVSYHLNKQVVRLPKFDSSIYKHFMFRFTKQTLSF